MSEQGTPEVDVRLNDLEVRAEFQARTVEDLDGVVREFAERVARLERELKELREQLELIGSGDGLDDSSDDSPGDSPDSPDDS